MGETAFNVGIGTYLDVDQLKQQVNNVTSSLGKIQPIKIDAQFANVDTGKAQEYLSSIQQEATAIESVIVKQRTLKNVAGDTLTGLTQMTIKYKDENGNLLTVVKELESAVSKIPKGFKVDEQIAGNVKLGASVREISKLYQQRLKEVDKMLERGKSYATKSENWDKNKKQRMQQLNAILKQQAQTYKDILNTSSMEGAEEAQANLQRTSDSIKQLVDSANVGAGAFSNFASHVRNAIKQTIAYTFSIGLMHNAQRFLNDGIKYAIELNRELVNIQVLQAKGAQTPEEVNALAKSFNNLAQEMGVTTLEVAKGSVEWLRQGKTITETTELLRASTMLGKLGNLSLAESTEYLTSTVNSYGLATEDVIGVVDKLIAVDNVSATSAKEMATALRYSAAAANEAGVSLEQLISYIAVVSSTTRQNAESIGQGMKTMFTRMEDIKAGAIDEDGLGINNVEIALKRVEIPLRDTSESFRDMGDVLEEVAGRWSEFTEVEQANIAKSIAGVRQRNTFVVLMQNMNDALDLQTEQFISTGLAADRYRIYLEGVEAAQNKLKASIEGLWQDAIKSGLITSLIDTVTWIVKLIDAIGGLNTVLPVTIALYLKLNKLLIAKDIAKMFSVFDLGTTAAAGLNMALGNTATAAKITAAGLASATAAVGSFIAVATGVGIAIVALAALDKYIKEGSERRKKAWEEEITAVKEARDNYKRLGDSKEHIKKLWEEFEELRDKQGKTAEELEKLIDLQNRLNDISMGTILGDYDEKMNYIIDENANLEQTNELLDGQLDILKEIAVEKAKASVYGYQQVAEDKAKKFALNEKIADSGGEWQFGEQISEFDKLRAQTDANYRRERAAQAKIDNAQIILEQKQHVRNVLDIYKTLEDQADKASFIGGLDPAGVSAVMAHEELAEAQAILEKEHPELIIPVKLEDEDLIKQVEQVMSTINAVDDAIEKLRSGEGGSKEIGILKEAGIEEWDIVGNKIIVATDAYQKFLDEQTNSLDSYYELSAAGKGYWDETKENLERSVEGIRLTESQYQSVGQTMAQTIYDAAVFSGASLTDTAGNALTSAKQVGQAIATHSISIQELIVQAGSKSLEVLNLLGSAGAGLAAKAAGLSNYSPTMPTFGGGGGGSADNPEKDRLEAEIKYYEKKKKAYDDQLKAYNKYIDAQIESLKLQKEEADFNDELAKKNKSLAKLKTEITILALDDSEEAKAKRLGLEEDAANLEEEITEDKEDRKYNLQVDALEKMREKFEASIEKQKDGIDSVIDKLKDEISTIKSLASGGGTGSYRTLANVAGAANDTIGAKVDEVIAKLENQEGELGKLEGAMRRVTNEWIIQGNSVDNALLKAVNYYNYLMNMSNIRLPAITRGERNEAKAITEFHEGGIVNGGAFSTGMKSNEIMARLLDGEVVANEKQMDNFVKKILPRFISYPNAAPTNITSGDTTFNMDINVEGSLDKTVIPVLKDEVADAVLELMEKRGIRRNAGSFSI